MEGRRLSAVDRISTRPATGGMGCRGALAVLVAVADRTARPLYYARALVVKPEYGGAAFR